MQSLVCFLTLVGIRITAMSAALNLGLLQQQFSLVRSDPPKCSNSVPLPCSNHAQPGDACGVVGLAFSGPQIQSATVLLDQDVADERTAEAAMQRLKAANIPEHNTIGFMFACVGRGYRHYKTKRNMEADAFRKFFPNVPLFGFFGHGEIGCDRIVTGNFVLRECNDIKDDLLHGYTTVMTLIHLGSTKANQA